MQGGAGRQILGKAKDAYPSDGPLKYLVLVPLALFLLGGGLIYGTRLFVDIWWAFDAFLPGSGLFAAVVVMTVAVTVGLWSVLRVVDLVSR